MAELRRLKVVRTQIKGQLTRINTFLSGQHVTQEQAVTRLKKLEELWITFNATQTQIEVAKAENDEQLERVMEEEQSERQNFEEAYYRASDRANSIVAAVHVASGEGEQEGSDANGFQEQTDVKLPTLKLPVFSGDYNEWMLFSDSFQSLIHNNRKLTDIQKFQYLRS